MDSKLNFQQSAIPKEGKLIEKANAIYAIASGIKRAEKINVLLHKANLFDEIINKNCKAILLEISCFSIKVTIEEIGTINDCIQEKIRMETQIIMTVSEDENLGESMGVSIKIAV
jgi:cell division GTPase FtsZ